MSDTDGVNNSPKNSSYLEWLENNWESFGDSEVPEEEPTPSAPYPFVGHPLWQTNTIAEQMRGWLQGMKIGLIVTGGIIALSGAWNALCWLVNNGQTGFGR